jgi:hypothetical protein
MTSNTGISLRGNPIFRYVWIASTLTPYTLKGNYVVIPLSCCTLQTNALSSAVSVYEISNGCLKADVLLSFTLYEEQQLREFKEKMLRNTLRKKAWHKEDKNFLVYRTHPLLFR